MANKLKIISENVFLFGKIFFLLSIGLCKPLFAETDLYNNTIDKIVEIPITKGDKSDCYIFNYDGYVLKASDEITIIGLKLFSGNFSFDFVFKNQFADDIKSLQDKEHINFDLIIDNIKRGTKWQKNHNLIYFEGLPYHIMFRHQYKPLKLELICTKEKVWYTGNIITENSYGRKLRRPKFEGGEWKRQLIDKKTVDFIVKPDQIRALMDKIGHKKFYKDELH